MYYKVNNYPTLFIKEIPGMKTYHIKTTPAGSEHVQWTCHFPYKVLFFSYPSDLMKSAVVDESLSSNQLQFCSRENHLATTLKQITVISLYWHAYRTWTWKSSVLILLLPNNTNIYNLHCFTSNNTFIHLQFWAQNVLVICIIVLRQHDNKHWLGRKPFLAGT